MKGKKWNCGRNAEGKKVEFKGKKMENIERKMVELKGEILGEKSEMWQKKPGAF